MGVPITPGSGRTIASDLVGSLDYQQIKIVDGTTGGTTGAVVGSDGGLGVTARRSARTTWTVNLTGAAPTAAYDLIQLTAPSSYGLIVTRLCIWNPGSQTTAGLRTLSLVRVNLPNTGTAVTPAPLEAGGTSFAGTAYTMATAGGTVTATLYAMSLYVPAAVGSFVPVVIDFDELGLGQAPTVAASGAIALRDSGATGAANMSVTLEFAQL
jgi:hypothetical protein